MYTIVKIDSGWSVVKNGVTLCVKATKREAEMFRAWSM